MRCDFPTDGHNWIMPWHILSIFLQGAVMILTPLFLGRVMSSRTRMTTSLFPQKRTWILYVFVKISLHKVQCWIFSKKIPGKWGGRGIWRPPWRCFFPNWARKLEQHSAQLWYWVTHKKDKRHCKDVQEKSSLQWPSPKETISWSRPRQETAVAPWCPNSMGMGLTVEFDKLWCLSLLLIYQS